MVVQKISGIVDFLADENLAGSVALVISKKTKDGYVLSPFHLGLDIAAVKNFRKSLHKLSLSLKQYGLEKYGAADTNPDNCLYVDENEVANLQMFKDVFNTAPVKLPQKELKNVAFHILRFQNSDGKNIYVFKRHTKSKVLRKSLGSALFISGTTLKIVKKDLFIFDSGADFIVYDGRVFIFQQRPFEKFFNFDSLYRAQAKKVFDFLRKNTDFTFTNIDDLELGCQMSLDKLRRLSVIYRREHYKKLSLSSIKKMNEDYGLALVIDEANKTIKVEKIAAFLRLFNDDLLSSPVSNNKYFAHNKTLVP